MAFLFVVMLIHFTSPDAQFTIPAKQNIRHFWVIFTLAFRSKEVENFPVIFEWFIRLL